MQPPIVAIELPAPEIIRKSDIKQDLEEMIAAQRRHLAMVSAFITLHLPYDEKIQDKVTQQAQTLMEAVAHLKEGSEIRAFNCLKATL